MTDPAIVLSTSKRKILEHLRTAEPPETSGAAISKATGVGTGRLYPDLHDLEEARWIAGEWEVLDDREPARARRRYYRLTPTGRRDTAAALAEGGTAGLDGLTPKLA